MHEQPASDTIMIVDDTPDNLRVLLQLLQTKGYRVLAFLCGIQALKAAAENPPDLVLLDVMMPRISGFEVCREMKSDSVMREKPILFISALNNLESIMQGFALGCADYITKPFHAEEVLARVETHIRLYRLRKEVEARNAILEHEVGRRTRELEKKNALLLEHVQELDQANTTLDVLVKKYASDLSSVVLKDFSKMEQDIQSILDKLQRMGPGRGREYQEMIESIRARLRGFFPSQPRGLVQNSLDMLSRREREIALYLRKGFSTKDVSQMLGITLRSVNSHCYNIRKKLAVPSKTRLKSYLMQVMQ